MRIRTVGMVGFLMVGCANGKVWIPRSAATPEPTPKPMTRPLAANADPGEAYNSVLRALVAMRRNVASQDREAGVIITEPRVLDAGGGGAVGNAIGNTVIMHNVPGWARKITYGIAVSPGAVVVTPRVEHCTAAGCAPVNMLFDERAAVRKVIDELETRIAPQPVAPAAMAKP